MSLSRPLPVINPIAPRRHLRPVGSTPAKAKPVVRNRVFVESRVRPAIITKLIAGIVTVIVLNFLVSMLCNQAIYSISQLKRESAALATQTQILEQQVDSLRSPQNLANSARSLGMVVNSNPVFLRVSSGQILGSNQPTSLSSTSFVSSNLIANAALISKSNPSKFQSTKLDIPKVDKPLVSSVKSGSSGVAEVVLPSSGIPASPTH
ncbi:MAG: hypothetical protein ACKOFA_04345 [Rhodoluna sp.]